MGLKAEAVPGDAGLSRCSTGEEGLDQMSVSVSVLTLKELLFFLRAGEGFSICHCKYYVFLGCMIITGCRRPAMGLQPQV